MAPAAAEVWPCPLQDLGKAGAVWRKAAYASFEHRAEQLGLTADPAFSKLLASIGLQTNELDQLWQRQQSPQHTTPWWADGEYDNNKADRWTWSALEDSCENDAGVRAHSAGKYSEALQHFTDAVRLAPTKAAYHCNRAAAALKLGQHAMALEDAWHALQRDPSSGKAYLRAASAQLGLHQYQDALQLYEACLAMQPGCRTAQAGLRRAQKLATDQAAQQAGQQQGNAQGSRPALAHHLVLSQDEAAQLLLSAEGALQACLDSHAAQCARVEALILCGRYKQAEEAALLMQPGWDQRYLQAEGDRPPGKCSELAEMVVCMTSKYDQARAAIEDGILQDAVDLCSQLLGEAPPACSGWICKLLCCRAEAQLGRMQNQGALDDLNQALDCDTFCKEALLLRSQAHKESGAFENSFLDLQKLSQLPHGLDDMLARLQAAAALCLSTSGALAHDGAGTATHSMLEVTPGASPAEIRQAYRRAARLWHPDKWTLASKSEQEQAATNFAKVQAAFKALCPV